MKQRHYYIFLLLSAFGFMLCAFSLQAQQLKLGSNPTQIKKSAVLQIDSKNQGVLLPRVPDTTDMASADIPDGMVIYFTDEGTSATGDHAGLYIRKDGRWQPLVVESDVGIKLLNGDSTKAQTLTVSSNPLVPVKFLHPGDGEHVLNIPDASETLRGVVNTGAQTFKGSKTINSGILGTSGLAFTHLTSSDGPIDPAAAPIGVNGSGDVVKALVPKYYTGGIGTAISENQVTKVWEAEIYNTSDGTASGASTTTTQGRITITIPALINFTNVLDIQVTAIGGNYVPPTGGILGTSGSIEQSVASVFSYDNSTKEIVISFFRFKASASLNVLGIPLLGSYSFETDGSKSRRLYIRVEGN